MPSYEKVGKDIADLQQRLQELQREHRRIGLERAQTVEPEYEFLLAPTESRNRIADPDCRLYRLEGVVLNRSELNAVGRTIHEGGMTYLYNRLSKRFVCSMGGGQVWLDLTEAFGRPADVDAFIELEAFIAEHPEGGDVTEIVNRARANRQTRF